MIVETLAFFAGTYSYFVANLVGVAIFGFAWWLGKAQRRMIVITGLSLVPFFPFFVFFNGDYWNPARIGGVPVGLEDAMCNFLIGSVAWLAATWPWRDSIRAKVIWPLMAKRGPYLAALGICVFLVFWFAGLDALTADSLANCFLAVVVILLRKDLWRIALCGLVTYAPVYCLHLKLVFLVTPDFALVWNQSNFWSTTVLGLPIGEIVAAGAMGCAFPTLAAYIFNARIELEDKVPAQQPEDNHKRPPRQGIGPIGAR